MKEKITSWQDRRVNAINRWSKRKGIPCNDLNPYFNEYDAILNSQAKTKKQCMNWQKNFPIKLIGN